MKTTVAIELNMYSPQIGQSHSVECSIWIESSEYALESDDNPRRTQRWESLRAIAMHTLHLSQSESCEMVWLELVLRTERTEKVFAKAVPYTTYTAVIAMIDWFIRVVVP